jgi:hypothetical protein
MKRRRLAKTIIGTAAAIGSVAYGKALIDWYDPSVFAVPHVRAAAISMAAGALIWLIIGRWLRFFAVFEHELTHLIFSVLMFQRPRSFYASDQRGHVASDRGNFLDELAPYFFPTYSYMLLAIYPVLRPSAYPYFYPALGFLTGYHIISNLGEFKPREYDIRCCGLAFSFMFCLFAGILTLGFIIAFIPGGFSGGVDFLRAGAEEAVGLLRLAGELARQAFSYLIIKV